MVVRYSADGQAFHTGTLRFFGLDLSAGCLALHYHCRGDSPLPSACLGRRRLGNPALRNASEKRALADFGVLPQEANPKKCS